MVELPKVGSAAKAGYARRIAEVAIAVTFIAVAAAWVKWAFPGTETINLLPVMIGAGVIIVFLVVVRQATFSHPEIFRGPIQLLVWAVVIFAVFGLAVFASAVTFEVPRKVAALIYSDRKQLPEDLPKGTPVETAPVIDDSVIITSAPPVEHPKPAEPTNEPALETKREPETNQPQLLQQPRDSLIQSSSEAPKFSRTIVYYKRVADGDRVINALKEADLTFSVSLRLGNSDMYPTNAIACSEDSDPEILGRIISALRSANVDIVRIGRFRSQKKGFEILNASETDGNPLGDPPIPDHELFLLAACPASQL